MTQDHHDHEGNDHEEEHDHEHVEAYLLDGAQMHFISLVAGTLGFLKERGISADEWTQYFGQKFYDSWEGLMGVGAAEALEQVIPIQVESMGAEIISGVGTEQRAVVTVGAIPSRAVLEKFGGTPRQILRGFGITQEEFAKIFDVFKIPASVAGFAFTHTAAKNARVITLRRLARRQAPKRGSRPRPT